MIESAMNRAGEIVGSIRRNVFNQGYTEYLISREAEDKRDIDSQLANMAGRLAMARQAKLIHMAGDEDLILHDEIYELERGRTTLSQEKTVQDR